MRPFLPALALLALGSSAVAGPKPPTTSDFEPEFAYTYTSGSSVDLRLANRAGDKAILVHRSTGSIGLFDVSIEGANRIAYRSGSDFYMDTWATSPFRITSHELLVSGPIVEGSDFSPGGGELAYATLGDASQIYVRNLASGLTESVLKTYSVLQLRWDPNDRVLYFTGRRQNSSDPTRVHKLDLTATDDPDTPADERVTPLFTPDSPLLIFDLSHAPVAASDARILIHTFDQIALWRTNGTKVGNLFPGNNAHFNCSNTLIVHRTPSSRRTTTRITDLAGNSQTWATDSNITRTDWIPQSPCP